MFVHLLVNSIIHLCVCIPTSRLNTSIVIFFNQFSTEWQKSRSLSVSLGCSSNIVFRCWGNGTVRLITYTLCSGMNMKALCYASKSRRRLFLVKMSIQSAFCDCAVHTNNIMYISYTTALKWPNISAMQGHHEATVMQSLCKLFTYILPFECRLFYKHFDSSFQWLLIVHNEKFLWSLARKVRRKVRRKDRNDGTKREKT